MNNIVNIVRSLESVALKNQSILVYTPTLRTLYNQPFLYIQSNQSRNLSLHSVLLKAVDTKSKSNPTKRAKRMMGYTIDDDNLIAKHIEMYGNYPSTFKKLTKELGRTNPDTIRLRYKFHIANQPEITGNYSPEEDKKILDYVEQYGRSHNHIEDLTLSLGRGSPGSVLMRLKYLTTGNVRDQKRWTLAEDKEMLKCLFDKKYLSEDDDSLTNIKPSDFKDVAVQTRRTLGSCNTHWQQFILPILKTHAKGLPLEHNWEWQERLMSYVMKEKAKAMKDLNFDKLLSEEFFAGQTYMSLTHFLNGLTPTKHRNGKKEFLFEIVAQKYDKKSLNIICFNEKKKRARLERAQEIIEYYEQKLLL